MKKCDNCGKLNPKTFPNSRLTKCCSTYDLSNKNSFYQTYDKNGIRVYSIGKSFKVKLRFPLIIRWIGFWK